MKTIVFVASPPRSGSSLVTSVVEAFGCSLGRSKTAKGDRYNERGYFENKRIFDFNRKLVGRNFFNPGFMSFPDEDMPIYVSGLAEIIKTDFMNSPLIAIKDPRVFQLTEIYQAYISQEFPVSVKVIQIWRSRDSVIKSLERFRPFSGDAKKAGKVYDGYHEIIGAAARRLGAEVLPLPLNALTLLPDNTAEIIGEFIGSGATVNIRKLIDKDLIHHGA